MSWIWRKSARSSAGPQGGKVGRAVWSAGRPGAERGPVDQLLDAAVESAGLQQVEVEVARAREDRLVPGLGGDHREDGDLDPIDESGGHQRTVHREASV